MALSFLHNIKEGENKLDEKEQTKYISYDELLELIDGLAESSQGKYGIITGYTNAFEVKDLNNIQDALLFIQELAIIVETERATIPQDTYIQNQIDEIVQLLYSTVYKLQNLQ